MTASTKHTSKADVLVMPSARVSLAGRSVTLRSRQNQCINGSTASLVSMRQHLCYKASIGIKDLVFIEQSYSAQVGEKLMGTVRELLDTEFGYLRVYRSHQVLVVRHHCMESLVAGLLRVQFHSCQIPMPVTREGDKMSDVCGVPVSWGIGHSLAEAEAKRRDTPKG